MIFNLTQTCNETKSPAGEIHIANLVTGYFFSSKDFVKIICFLDGEKIDVVFRWCLSQVASDMDINGKNYSF